MVLYIFVLINHFYFHHVITGKYYSSNKKQSNHRDVIRLSKNNRYNRLSALENLNITVLIPDYFCYFMMEAGERTNSGKKHYLIILVY
jgi:hypothetical protein